MPRLPETLETQRLRLRSPVEADAKELFRSYTQDPRVCRFMVWEPHRSESATQKFIASCINDWKTGTRFAYIVTERNSQVAIGMLEARLLSTTVDIGYVLASTHWGKGLMPEAVKLLTEVALKDKQVFRVQASCDIENIASQRTLEKAGFSREARLERYTVHPNISSEPRPCFMYALCR